MIISILRKNFLSYTQRVCSELGINSLVYEFDNETYFLAKGSNYIPSEDCYL